MRLVCVIPARVGSTRLPAKPLRLLGGEPLIRVVARRALALELTGEVLVASDDPRVLDAVAPLDITGLLTASHHASGTERVAEVAAQPAYVDADILLNIQGDEPFVSAAAAWGAVGRVLAGDDIGTAAQPLTDGAWRDPQRVKVDVDGRGRASRFFRTPTDGCRRGHATFQHIGAYAYTPSALRRWVALPVTDAERAEGLEQLRPLAHGFTIGVAVVAEAACPGIDTEEDLRLAEALL